MRAQTLRSRQLAIYSLATIVLAGCEAWRAEDRSLLRAPTLERQRTPTTQRLQALAPVDADVIWASGTGGVVLRTADGGKTWQDRSPLDAGELELRDLEAFSADLAYALAAGPGDRSRIFKTDDGGVIWREQWRNAHADAFFDCFDFWDQERGLVWSDAIEEGVASGDGDRDDEVATSWRFPLLRVEDGEQWQELVPSAPPSPFAGEGGFAASGTCLMVGSAGEAWLGTGAGGAARIFHTTDYGDSWRGVATPIVAPGQAAGITTLSFLDSRRGFAAGGDIADQESIGGRVAKTLDGGATWSLVGDPSFSGAIYGLAAFERRGGHEPWLIAVGPRGADLSRNGGATWSELSRESWWSVAIGEDGTAWLAGPDGRLERVTFD